MALFDLNVQQMLDSGLSPGGATMAKGEQRGNREAKKPKKEKTKTIAAAPSTKGTVASITASKK